MNFKHEPNRIFLESEDGKTIAEVTYTRVSDDVVNIDHTFVDKSLRGQGIASKLMSSLVDDLKRTNKKSTATCSYAQDWFEQHKEFNDIYIKRQ